MYDSVSGLHFGNGSLFLLRDDALALQLRGGDVHVKEDLLEASVREREHPTNTHGKDHIQLTNTSRRKCCGTSDNHPEKSHVTHARNTATDGVAGVAAESGGEMRRSVPPTRLPFAVVDERELHRRRLIARQKVGRHLALGVRGLHFRARRTDEKLAAQKVVEKTRHKSVTQEEHKQSDGRRAKRGKETVPSALGGGVEGEERHAGLLDEAQRREKPHPVHKRGEGGAAR